MLSPASCKQVVRLGRMQTCQVEEEAVLGEADPDERRVCIDRLRKAIEELRELHAKVHQCAERSRLVNALAEARRAAEDLSQSLPVGRDASELRGTLPGIVPSGGSEAATGERRPGAAPEGISSGPVSVDLFELVAMLNDYLDRLYAPFPRTESSLKTCLDNLRQLLNDLPLEPPQLRELRSEVERLEVWKRTQHFPPPAMWQMERDLPILGRKLQGMLEVLLAPSSDPTAGPQKRRQKPPVDPRIVDLKRLVREFYEEIVRQGRRGEIHEQICMRLANHDRPPNVKWGSLPWPKALDRYPKAVRTWISKAIHQAR
jgi:hypothetical protein